MNLLALNNRGVSLEFSYEEWPTIRAGLSAVGPLVQRAEVTHDVVSVNEIELILLDEWDAPCLISLDERGDAILRRLSNAPSLANERRDAA